MTFQLDFPGNIVAFAGSAVGWMIVLVLLLLQFRKPSPTDKPALWKALLALLAGMFSFSIQTAWFGVPVKLALLPIGVILLAVALRKRNRRSFYIRIGWIGFAANYVFLAVTLLSAAVHNGLYAKEKASTYLAELSQVRLIAIHPSGEPASLDKERLQREFPELRPEAVDGLTWHREAIMENSPQYKQERFPYMLIGAKSSWGSGLRALIYIEADGKGLLIHSPDKDYYFRSESMLVERGGAA